MKRKPRALGSTPELAENLLLPAHTCVLGVAFGTFQNTSTHPPGIKSGLKYPF